MNKMKMKIYNLKRKTKDFFGKYSFKIIRKEEYILLKDIEKDYVKLCKERNIEPMSEIETILMCSPLMQIGTRFLLKRLKDFRNRGE